MPPSRTVDKALTLLARSTNQQYVCRACRSRATRQFHATPSLPAESPGFFKSMRESLFGSKESKETEKRRQEKIKQKLEEQSKKDAASKVEIKVDRHGREYEVAALVDVSINPDYIQSSNWDGLKRIGSERWVKESRDKGEPYMGFMPRRRARLNDDEWRSLLHHVTVEILTSAKAGQKFNDVCLPRFGQPLMKGYTRDATIVVDSDTGNLVTQFATPEAAEGVVAALLESQVNTTSIKFEEGEEHLSSEEDVTRQSATQASEADELLEEIREETTSDAVQDVSWLESPLTDPALKFTIAKRILQLTGHRISDSRLSNTKTLADLYIAYKTKEPAKKLAYAPELDLLDQTAPNVSVHKSRQTPIDKDRAVGRWKLIEDELTARDLPVTGSRFVGAKPRLGVER